MGELRVVMIPGDASDEEIQRAYEELMADPADAPTALPPMPAQRPEYGARERGSEIVVTPDDLVIKEPPKPKSSPI